MGNDRTRSARLDPATLVPPLILIGLGANLDSPRWGTPRETLTAALTALEKEGACVLARSAWYRSAPVPPSDQPWFINAVVSVATRLDALGLLMLMQAIEQRFGRVHSQPNAARVIDLDLLDYCGEQIISSQLVLPHPRLHQRRFVLEPLVEIAPEWRHPISNLTAQQLLVDLTSRQPIERLSG